MDRKPHPYPDTFPPIDPPQKKRDREYQRLRKEADDKCKQYIDWAQRFEAKSASWYPREDGTRTQLDCLPILTRDYADDMPGHIETMFDECEDSSDILPVLRRASKAEAGWLARFTRDRVEKERETLDQELERELQVCIDSSRSARSGTTP